jgi:hypothetical protein
MQELRDCERFKNMRGRTFGDVTKKLIAMPMMMKSGTHANCEVCKAKSVHYYVCRTTVANQMVFKEFVNLSVRSYCILCETEKELQAVQHFFK